MGTRTDGKISCDCCFRVSRIVPSLNVAARLLGFFFIKLWVTILSKFGFSSTPLTGQENTVIQTCVVATSGIAFTSGYASYILGMTNKVAEQGESFANSRNNVNEMHFLWMLIFVFVVSFVGLFSIVPLRKL